MTSTAKDRPLVTFAIMAYNEAAYIKPAIEAAFAQTYSPLEIILSDDASTDETFAIMKDMAAQYTGPHKVILSQNPKNLHIVRHMNKVIALSKGELFVKADGDDISSPERTEKLVAAWLSRSPRPSGLYSAYHQIHEDGQELGIWRDKRANWFESPHRIAETGHSIIGAVSAWDRRLLDEFFPLSPALRVEDVPLSFQATLRNGVVYLDEALVHRRMDVSNWHAFSGPLKSDSTYRKNLRFLAQFAYQNALQAALDASRETDFSLQQAAFKRLFASYLRHRATSLPSGDLLALQELLSAYKKLPKAAENYFKHRFPQSRHLGKKLKAFLKNR